MAKHKTSVYDVITDRIVDLLEKGEIPWHKPWASAPGEELPMNLKSGKAYRGINVFLLWCGSLSYGSPYWVTYKQAKALGGQVRKGEKGFPVLFWKWLEKEAGGKKKRIPCARYYTVFNALGQCDGLDGKLPQREALHRVDVNAEERHQRIEACEAVAAAYDGPTVVHGARGASYNVNADRVRMPSLSQFDSAEDYYCTLFHELGHSTGHPDRLDRDLKPLMASKHDYSKEELIAEMSAAFLCAVTGIEQTTIENSAAYIQGWLKQIRGDSKLVVQAAAKAQKATDLILGVTWNESADTADERKAA